MSLNKKIAIFLILFTSILVISIAIVLVFSFRNYSKRNVIDKADVIANIVKDGLTVHMENNIVDKRYIFLSKIREIEAVKNLKVLRSKKVDELFKTDIYRFQKIDPLEKDVLKNGRKKYKIVESLNKAILKIAIPYIASSYEMPNCLKCHTNAKEGDVLGVISMEFDITNIREYSLLTIGKIVALIFTVFIIAFFVFNFFIKKYLEFFHTLRDVLKRAYEGDYSKRVREFKDKELDEVSKWLNVLLEKLEKSLQTITKSVSYFIDFKSKNSDPLLVVKDLVSELASIYKLKNIIEQDSDRMQAYNRIIELTKNKYKIEKFIFYEVDKKNGYRKVIYNGLDKEICKDANKDIALCRAIRIGDDIFSDKYLQICKAVKSKDFYICIPLDLTDDYSVVISFIASSKEEYEKIKNIARNFKNYLVVSKSTIETVLLLEELKMQSLKDGLTQLYNRRYLDIFVKETIPKALRTNISISILMIDIDYFKMINDKYGHDIGDMVIKELSSSIIANIRESDVAIRFGGEEFLVLLYDCKKKDAINIAKKIKNYFGSRKFFALNESFSKSISVGISEFPKDTTKFWQAIKFADMALYRAKEKGRDMIIVYTKEEFKKSDNY